MTPVRSALPSVARMLALAVLATQVTVSAGSTHAMCAAAKHDCGSTARIAACCCASDTEASHAAGPVVAAVRVAPLTPSAVVCLPYRVAPPFAPPLHLATDPANAPPGDLTILLSNLRI